jgi:hypothetical protein
METIRPTVYVYVVTHYFEEEPDRTFEIVGVYATEKQSVQGIVDHCQRNEWILQESEHTIADVRKMATNDMVFNVDGYLYSTYESEMQM